MIEAEALLAALQRAQDGLTLKQLIAQLPDGGGRKPKLRPALRTLVAEGRATFDGQRYHAADGGKPIHTPSLAVEADSPAPETDAHAEAPAAAASGAQVRTLAQEHVEMSVAQENGRAAMAASEPDVAEPVEETVEDHAEAHEHENSHRAKSAHARPGQDEAEPLARDHVVAHEHKPKKTPSPAKAAAHAPHGHIHGKGAKTSAAKIPAALAEGIRLRRDAKAKSDGTPDPRGAANWGIAREKPAPAPRQRSGELVGLLHLKSEGYGFVSPLLGASSRDEDIFVPPGSSGSAIDGDIVQVRLSPGRDGRTIGEVTKIVEERRQLAIGAYHLRGKDAFVEPHDRRMAGPILVPSSPDYSEGELVKVQIRRGAAGTMRGDVLGPLGPRGEARFEILAAAYAQGFSDEFDAAVRDAAAALPDQVRPEDHAGRRDLREMPLATIDGEDARDFDDAVYVERSGAGYRLVVAIADVASYVHEDGPIDREGLRRATSVYFPGTVLPMLPEQLSNGICSLNPDVERLCMVCDLQLDASGAPISAEVYPAVMRSHARLTYTVVAEVLEGKTPAEPRVAARVADLKLAGELAKKMTAIRLQRGALDFDLPEAKIILDDKGEVVEISSRPRNDAHRLVEEFMLAANEAVARFFSQHNLPTLYRVHDQPDADKLEAFGQLAQAHGFHLPDRLTPSALGMLLKQLDGAPAQRALTQLLLRAMMQAHYAPDDIGHYGLAAPTYLHFTSPIRRYPDLTVHRLLWKHWARDGKPQSSKEREEEDAQLAGVGAQCSERERAAMRAERDVVSFYSAAFMQQHVGEEFAATITGVSDLGLFCQLDSPAVEGLVPAETLGHGMRLDQELQRLTAGSSGKTWALGESVRIRVASAEPARRRINFTLLGGAEEGDTDEAGGEHAGSRGRAPSKAARAFIKSENHGKPKRGGDSPAWSRGGKKGRPGAPAHEPRGFAPDRGFGKELSRGLAKGKERGGSSEESHKPKLDAAIKSPSGKLPHERGAKERFHSHDDGAKGRFHDKDSGRDRKDLRGQATRSGKAPGRGRPERTHSSQGRHAPAQQAPGQQAPTKRWGQAAPAPRAAEKRGSQQTSGEWLREDDIAPLANARPAPRPPIAAPPRGRSSSRGGPPPRHGQKPSRRR